MKSQDVSFDWTIAPVTPEEFFAEYFEKKHLVIKRNQPDYYSGLLSFAQIDHVVTTMGLHAPEISVTKSNLAAATDSDTAPKAETDSDTTPKPATDSDTSAPAPRRIEAADYTFATGYVDPVRVSHLFADGATVILSGLHERLPQLGRFCRALESALSCRVQTNIYMTPRASQGFRPHYDSHDVLVLQVEGTKEWRIYDTPVELPLQSQAFNPDTVTIGEEIDRFVLEPGDMCYVPRGMTHDAVATDGTSLHITTGLTGRTWADLVAEAVSVVAHGDPAFRATLPPGYANRDFEAGKYQEHFEGLIAKLAEKAPLKKLFEGFKHDFLVNRVPRVEGQLEQMTRLDGLKMSSKVGPRPHLIYDLHIREGDEIKPGSVSVSCYDNEVSLPLHAKEPLAFALETPSFKISDLPGDLDDEGKLVLVRRLIKEGLLMTA